MPLIVSELAPAESSKPEVARERVALAGVARREVALHGTRPSSVTCTIKRRSLLGSERIQYRKCTYYYYVPVVVVLVLQDSYSNYIATY